MLGALVLMRGETFIETIEGGMAVMMFLPGTATIMRQRAGAQVGLHLTRRLAGSAATRSPTRPGKQPPPARLPPDS